MISKFLRLSNPMLTTSGSEEMPRLGVGPTRHRCGRRECPAARGRSGSPPDPSPAGGQRLSSDPGNAPRVGSGVQNLPRQRSGGRAGREGGAGGTSAPRPLPSTQVLSNPSSRFSPPLHPQLFSRTPLHSNQLLWFKNSGGGFQRNHPQ